MISSYTSLPSYEIKQLAEGLRNLSVLSSEEYAMLEQINTLTYAGLIPPKEGLLLKNNLHNKLVAEGILAELILHLTQEGKFAPEMNLALKQKGGFKGALHFLYTCYLEKSCSTASLVNIQQKIWKSSPQEIFASRQRLEELENKECIQNWLSSLTFTKEELKNLVEGLLKPLTAEEFKEKFLQFLHTLYLEEPDIIYKFCLQEWHNLLQTKEDSSFFFTLSQLIKSLIFYQKHLTMIENGSWKDTQLSLFLAADANKNGPWAKELPTYYSLFYAKVRNCWEKTLQTTVFPKRSCLIEGCSQDEKAIAETIQSIFSEKKEQLIKIPVASLHSISSLEEKVKFLLQILLKTMPERLIAPVSCKEQIPLLGAAKELQIPLLFLPSYTKPSEWEESTLDEYSLVKVGFPTPLHVDFLEEVSKEKTAISGVPGLPRITEHSIDSLKKAWNFAPESKILVIHTPEGDSPWPAFLAKHYNSRNDIAIVVLTEEKNSSFIHKIKTKIAPFTQIPIQVLTTLSPSEKEEILTLANVVIDKERKDDSSLLLTAGKLKTPILIDNSPPSIFSEGLLPVLHRTFSDLFSKKDDLQTEIHEDLLNNFNLGIMIRSKRNFSLALEELLAQEKPSSAPLESLMDGIPSILESMKSPETSPLPLSSHFQIFSSHAKS